MSDAAKIKPVHRNVLLTCMGGYSNTGITSAQACMELVQEVGLDRVAVGCLSAVPLGEEPVLNKTRAAERIIAVDGCPKACARRLAEGAGLKLHASLVLSEAIGMKKFPLSRDIGGDLRPMDRYIERDDIERAKAALRALLA